MSELSKSFIASEHEAIIRQKWEESGFFNPDKLDLPDDAPNYTIILPPPNVTDRLHLGHASMLAIEDLLIRFHRLSGFRTLWLPGTDHAAIATQTVVEKQLYQETKQTRHDIGREKFLEKVKSFALETQETILNQIKTMGASLDWSRLAFTLDEERQKAVQKMFIDMYEAGALYRGERIVNWCPRCQSTLADDEVEYIEKKTPFYYFKYGPIVIGTARPETKFADKVIIVHPSDKRFKDLVGKKFMVPWIEGEVEATVIADESADPELGTGAMTITPAHSFVDFALAQKYNLDIVKIIDEAGNLTKAAGRFAGQKASAARDEIVKVMTEKGLVDHIDEKYVHNLSVCYRCATPIEPLPSLQWFVAVDKPLKKLKGQSLKQAALEVAEKKKISFVPDRFSKQYLNWMTNLHDWCISRQIWFGHQIPAWYRSSAKASDGKSGDEIYVGEKAPAGEDWKKDEDTLDTWFSSGMWTFSTLGWPDSAKASSGKPSDLERFHPTDVLETGYEIITLWVSRMIMMSLFAMGEIPFKTVYLHGMVLDKQGKKMSKSKGNGLDPVIVAEQYGVDAVRLSLLLGSTPGIDTRVSEEKIVGFRNLVNKLWNISRYILNQEVKTEKIDYKLLTMSETWILSRLQETITTVTEKIKNYDFSGAGESLRVFTLDDLADWYLEASKFENSKQKGIILQNILETILKLWHPFMPFVTEAIWQTNHDSLLMVAEWPTADKKLISKETEESFSLLREVIISIRNLRSEHKLPPTQKLKVIIYAGQHQKLFESFTPLIKSLRTGLQEVEIKSSGEGVPGALYARVQSIDVYLVVEVDRVAEKKRLQNELEKLQNIKQALKTRLSNIAFNDKAPKKIIEQEKNKLAVFETAIEKIKTRLDELHS